MNREEAAQLRQIVAEAKEAAQRFAHEDSERLIKESVDEALDKVDRNLQQALVATTASIEDKIQTEILEWMPKRARRPIKEGHSHGAGGAGLIHFDYVISASYTGPAGLVVRLATGNTRLYSTIQGACSHAITEVASKTFFICGGDYSGAITFALPDDASDQGWGDTNFHFIGASRATVRLIATANAQTIFTATPGSFPGFTYGAQLFISNLTLDHSTFTTVVGVNSSFAYCRIYEVDGVANSSSSGTALYISGLDFAIENCRFHAYDLGGAAFAPAVYVENGACRISDCSFYDVNDGIEVNCTPFVMTGGSMFGQGEAIIGYGGVGEFVVAGVSIESFATGMDFTQTGSTIGPSNIAITGNYIDAGIGIDFDDINPSGIWKSGSIVIDSNVFELGVAGTGIRLDAEINSGHASNNHFSRITGGAVAFSGSVGSGFQGFHNTGDSGPSAWTAVAVADFGSPVGHSTTAVAAPSDAQYLTLAANATLTNERVFTPRYNIYGTDGGAGAAYSLDSWLEGAAITPAAGTLTLGTDGDAFHVEAGNFSTIGTPTRQTLVLLVFNGVSVLTHGANLILQGAVNFTSAAGDIKMFFWEGGTVWREVSHAPVTLAGVGHTISGQVITGVTGNSGELGHVQLATQTDADAGTSNELVPPINVLPKVLQSNKYTYAADSVGTDSYAISLGPGIGAGAYEAGQIFHFKAGAANTGACTLAVNGQAATAIKKLHDQDLADGDIELGQIVTVAFDGTNFQMQSQIANAPAAGSGHTIRENGVDLTARTGLNFVDTDADADIVQDDAGGDETEVHLDQYLLNGLGRATPQTLIGGTASGADLDLQSTSHATRGHIRAVDELLAANYLTVRQDGGTDLGTVGQLNILVDGTRTSAIYLTNGSGSWPSVAGSPTLFNIVASLNVGTAGTSVVTGLGFNPLVAGGSAFDRVTAVQALMGFNGQVGGNDIEDFRAGTPAFTPAPFSLKRFTGLRALQPHGGGATGGYGFYAGVNIDPASATRNAGFSLLDTIGVRLADIPKNQRTSERAFGVQIDLFDGTANGVQWPIYYGDVTQAHPTVFRYDGAAYTDHTTEAATAVGTEFTVLDGTDDFFYIGTTSPTTFRRVLMTLNTIPSAGDLAVEWDYSNGAAGWPALTVTASHADFSARGFSMSFTPPTDWAAEAVNGTTRYWIRCYTTLAVTTPPTCLMVLVDTDNHVPQFAVDTAGQPWIGGTPTAQANAAGSALHTSTTETSLSAAINIPANVLEAGSVLRCTARGVYGTDAIAPTLQMRVRWGGVAGTVLGDTGAVTAVAALVNRGWEVEFLIRVVSIGATGTMECQGMCTLNTSGTLGTNQHFDMENTAVVTVDTTVINDLCITADWGTSDADNTIICRQWLVERLI